MIGQATVSWEAELFTYTIWQVLYVYKQIVNKLNFPCPGLWAMVFLSEIEVRVEIIRLVYWLTAGFDDNNNNINNCNNISQMKSFRSPSPTCFWQTDNKRGGGGGDDGSRQEENLANTVYLTGFMFDITCSGIMRLLLLLLLLR